VALGSLILFQQVVCCAGRNIKVKLNLIDIIVIGLIQFHHWDAQNGIVSLFDEDDQSPANTQGV